MSTDLRARIKFILSIVLGIAAIVAGFQYFQAQPSNRSKPARAKAAAARTPQARPAQTVALPAPMTAPPPAVATAPTADAASAAAPSSSDTPAPEAPGTPSLEDLTEKAMRAVVMITTAKTRASGFIVRPSFVVTNAHVTAGSATVSLETQAGAKMDARVAEVSDDLDLAVIHAPGIGAIDVPLPLGSALMLRLGQPVVALGWAQSLQQSAITRGVVIGLQQIGPQHLIQSDGVPNHGDSGGPLLNRAGEVVGVTTAIGRFDNGGTVGLAVSVADLKPLLAAAEQKISSLPGAYPTAPARTAEIDTPRASGSERYTAALAALATRAEALDAAWLRYKSDCRITGVPGGQSREWFVLYDPGSPLHRAPEACTAALREIQRQADGIGTDVRAADDAARQAGVLPGTRRELHTRHRLDYQAWDR